MVVFKYKLLSQIEQCHFVLLEMELPGEPVNEELNPQTQAVWKGEDFIALWYPEESRMELYGTKNTNSVNYFIMRYGKLDWDTFSIVRTKRWK